MDRRNFLRIMAATGAGLAAGCDSRVAEKLIPYLQRPENIVPGVATYYATTCRECPAGCGVLARTREGRAVKLEGNENHPHSAGALCARGQAALQGLYNPDRVTNPLARDGIGRLRRVSWERALKLLVNKVKGPVEAGRAGAVAFLTGETADSDADLVRLLSGAAGMRNPVNLRLYTEDPLAAATGTVFGRRAVPEFHPGEADLIVSLGADFLETWGNPVAMTAGFTRMHAYRHGTAGRAVYVGPRQSNTAAACDEWVRLVPGREAAALLVIADEILMGKSGNGDPEAEKAGRLLAGHSVRSAEEAVGAAADRLRKLGKELAGAKAPLVIASGLEADAEQAHALALLITHLCGGSGNTLTLPEPGRAPHGDPLSDTETLLEDLESGNVETLLVHESNPAFLLPGTASSLEKAGFVACFTTQLDETAARAHLVLPINHPLESWGCHAASAGFIGLMQPVMRSLFGTKEFADLLLEMAGALPGAISEQLPWRNAREFVEEQIKRLLERAGETRDIHKQGGIKVETATPTLTLAGDGAIKEITPPEDGLLVRLFPHPYFYDGRGADKPWLQEVPETSTAICWGSWAELHPDTAHSHFVKDGDAIKLKRDGAEITVPVLVTSQVMPGTVAVPIGLGHERMGRWAGSRGANPLKLAPPAGTAGITLAGFAVDYSPVLFGGPPIRVSGSENQGTRGLARAVPIGKVGHEDEGRNHNAGGNLSLYPEHEHPEYDWGMTIDLDACVGCGACVAACYAENNIGVTGPERVAEGREMAWIRIERYIDGDDVRLLPNLCQHCHSAPCEPVCPVFAAYHTDEGTNAQIYNRCVGTRYCSNNCPYKVRRFNFFDYRHPKPLHLQLNPDVTVRERGVMEKCTFCLQRIKEKKEIAKNEGRTIRDGEVVPACAQTCPARAITFGNLKDPGSRVSRLFEDPRAYLLLGELNIRPSIAYLKKVLRTKDA